MLNYEKYLKKMLEDEDKWCEFVKKNIFPNHEGTKCPGTTCTACAVLQALWMMQEYKEPEVDWTKVEVDMPAIVWKAGTTGGVRRHFAKYENGKIYVWKHGTTSWTGSGVDCWDFAELVDSENSADLTEYDNE